MCKFLEVEDLLYVVVFKFLYIYITDWKSVVGSLNTESVFCPVLYHQINFVINIHTWHQDVIASLHSLD